MNQNQDLYALLRETRVDDLADAGFSQRVIQRIDREKRRRGLLLGTTAVLATVTSLATAGALPTPEAHLDPVSIVAGLVLLALGGLVMVATESVAPRGQPIPKP